MVWCATSPQLDGIGGVYCEKNNISPLVELQTRDVSVMEGKMQTPVGVVAHAIDPQIADRLWDVSEQLVFGKKQ
ncbi:hypothetical protein EDD76_12221 [Kineothrix alysoides]|uniref:Uncharacterized protein n=1 Tax=Kineothrix alysoides TaxID=1469948 RepID=A0A4R1QTC0_9FIRM|nr:hypothetical protein [Kineothrix alysoides]TCL54104.1 hypothetical protein EDD76_12221 [Kineothrix alysoides]